MMSLRGWQQLSGDWGPKVVTPLCQREYRLGSNPYSTAMYVSPVCMGIHQICCFNDSLKWNVTYFILPNVPTRPVIKWFARPVMNCHSVLGFWSDTASKTTIIKYYSKISSLLSNYLIIWSGPIFVALRWFVCAFFLQSFVYFYHCWANKLMSFTSVILVSYVYQKTNSYQAVNLP